MKIEINMSHAYQILTMITSIANIVITVFIAIYLFKKEPSKTYIKERYEKVVSPLYFTFEPFLYNKSMPRELLLAYKKCQSIVNENKNIAGGKYLFLFNRPLDVYTLTWISREIDKDFDKSCKSLGLPKRTLQYKVYLIKNAPKRYLIELTLFSYLPLIIFIAILFLAIFLIRVIPILQFEFV